ncbi:MAG: hypothetical protein B7Z68_01400 [Acidobacteria bacterium 21-70-11]|nr:MAG: hypothetical protein B7Z68_01400 [Acidobacteria bacterium 21-70-11]OYW06857.1 MAG: hypothetical protein B7Z61_00970 [Acidobacteria bacterium 37-71-11]HQT95487.1 hypothetical protein [Thermoanaerobaculaceae bacterium]HQU32849.1 hypothetical protein [Thermoanaerobaculaceae bacterium]
MKLGIAVVYLVREGNERLLDLHLESIRRHTGVPYVIYASANRLAAGMQATLRRRPEVRALDLPATALRTSEEHAWYLEQLIAAALDDGVTHVAVFHVDSFPVRPGWAQETAEALSERRPFAAAVRDTRCDDKPFTAFMLMQGKFLRERRPHFLLDGGERRSAAYRKYRRRFPHHPDSGVGFGLLAYREDLEWLRLERSNRGEDHAHFGSIYGDTVFHLGAAAWRRKDFPGSRGPTGLLDLRARLAPMLGHALPGRARRALKGWMSRAVPALDIEAKYAVNEAAFEAVRQRLLADPDAYLAHLRSG